MKFTVEKPKPPKPESIAIQVHDVGGYEGVSIEVTANMGTWGPHEGLMAISPEGEVWTGDSYSVRVGHFEEDGSFVWDKKLEALG